MSKLRECGEKKVFASRREANAFALMLKRRYLDFASPYKCKYCNHWHIGHPRGLRRNR